MEDNLSIKHYADSKIIARCNEIGIKFLQREEDNKCRVVLSCGHIASKTDSYLMKANNFFCDICLENKYREEAKKHNIEYISRLYNEDGKLSSRNLYRLSCGCTKEITPNCVQTDSFVCTNCRLSREEYLKKYREDHREHINLITKQWNEENSAWVKKRRKLFYQNNKDTLRDRGKKHYQENKPTYLCYSRTRKAEQKRRTPPWLSKEQKKEILQFYIEAKRLFDETGIKYHVDHIVPLQGELVSGLHVPWNLQLLTEAENLSKTNHFEIE